MVNIQNLNNNSNSINKNNFKKIQSIVNKPNRDNFQQNSPQQNFYPLTEENQTINSLLSNRNVPDEIIQKYWWIFSRDLPLTFLDEKRKKDKLLAFDILKIDILNSLPYYDYDFKIEQELNTARVMLDVKCDRALGTNKSQQINERIVQKSQFSENRSISEDSSNQAKSGFISKLLNRR